MSGFFTVFITSTIFMVESKKLQMGIATTITKWNIAARVVAQNS
jgi:hypothetical protein